jgi:hypothetical protein
LTIRTGSVVVQRTTRVSPLSSSIARVVSETNTVTGLVPVGAAEGDLQRGRNDPELDPAAAEDLRGKELVAGQRDVPEHAASNLHGIPILDGWQRRRAGWDSALRD